MTDLLENLLDDLEAEGDLLRTAVAGLDEDGWRTPTPAPGWDVSTQIGHLPGPTRSRRSPPPTRRPGTPSCGRRSRTPRLSAAAEIGRLGSQDLLARWGAARTGLADALRGFPAGEATPWFGPPMSPASMATARSWRPGRTLDVYEAIGVEPEITDRIRPVAHLGVRTRDFAFSVHGLDAPGRGVPGRAGRPVRRGLDVGPEGAAQTVVGSAYDFCLLVTQRRHRADTDLVATGADAERWLGIAQAFAGPPGAGRAPGASLIETMTCE